MCDVSAELHELPIHLRRGKITVRWGRAPSCPVVQGRSESNDEGVGVKVVANGIVELPVVEPERARYGPRPVARARSCGVGGRKPKSEPWV